MTQPIGTIHETTIRSIIYAVVLALLLIPFHTASADCKNAIRLKVGDSLTDCDRIGYSLKYDLKVREDLIDYKYTLKVIVELKNNRELLKDTVKIIKDKNLILSQDAKDSREAYDKERNRGQWKFYVGLAAGIIGFFLAAKAVQGTF